MQRRKWTGIKVLALGTVIPLFSVEVAFSQHMTLLLGGDVAWMETVQFTPFDQDKVLSCPMPSAEYGANSGLEKGLLKGMADVRNSQETDRRVETLQNYPFEAIAPVLKNADMTFVNLETPISDKPRHDDLQFWAPQFQAHPQFAQALSSAGIDVVSTANNHALDSGQLGLKSTLMLLEQANIQAVGTGKTLEQARQPAILQKNQIRIAFLAYTETENSLLGMASPARSGPAPLDVSLIQEDIQKVRSQVDHVVVSLHWGKIGRDAPSPKMRRLAHTIVDAGADIIVGHHPHIPYGVELYQGKPIFYSLGNLIFSYSRSQWTDGFLAKISLTPSTIQFVEILPVSGQGCEVAQPRLLQQPRAQEMLDDLRVKSEALGSTMQRYEKRGCFGCLPN